MSSPTHLVVSKAERLLRGLLAGALALAGSGALADQVELPLGEIRELLESEWVVSAPTDWSRVNDPSGLRGLLREQDPYAEWMAPAGPGSEARANLAAAGIGAELSVHNGQAFLLPRQSGPLARMGFAETLELLAIDGRELSSSSSVEEIAAMLQGAPESPVSLLLASSTTGERWEARLFRESIRPLDVELWHAGSVGIVRILEFRPRRTRSALEATLNLLGSGTRWVVVDLRSASGGDLYEALDAVDAFLPTGVELLRMRAGRGDETVAVSRGPGLQAPLLVLLVGPETASAAEIFAGVLQFHGRARLAGQPTYGKCSSQTSRPLSDGSRLRFTNLRLYFPDGSTCNEVGLSPDQPWGPPRGVMGADLVAAVDGLLLQLDNLPLVPAKVEANVDGYAPDPEDLDSLRVLRAWGLLPARFDRLALDLYAVGRNLFDATPEGVRQMLEEARSDAGSPLRSLEAALADLEGFLADSGWYGSE